jgi:hypothetical protein
MGPTDYTWNYGGWNIDDVEVTGIPAPPEAPGQPDLLDEDDSGVSDTDNITGIELARIDIYVYDPKTIHIIIYNGVVEMGQASNLGNGYWRYQFTSGQLTRGDNVITAVAVGLSGYSGASAPLTISYKTHTLSADVDGDGVVGLPDLDLMATYWLSDESSVDLAPPGGDDRINFLDLAVLGEQWLHSELWY